MNSLQECENCNYSGILPVDKFLAEEMKRKVSKEYFKQQRMFFKLKSSSWNLIQGINTLIESLLTLLSLEKKILNFQGVTYYFTGGIVKK